CGLPSRTGRVRAPCRHGRGPWVSAGAASAPAPGTAVSAVSRERGADVDAAVAGLEVSAMTATNRVPADLWYFVDPTVYPPKRYSIRLIRFLDGPVWHGLDVADVLGI